MSFMQKAMQKTKRFGAVVLAAVGLAASSAPTFAALPPEVAATVSEISGNATGIFGAVFPVVGTVIGLVVVIKLFKRFSNKI